MKTSTWSATLYVFYSNFTLQDSLHNAVSEHLEWLKFQKFSMDSAPKLSNRGVQLYHASWSRIELEASTIHISNKVILLIITKTYKMKRKKFVPSTLYITLLKFSEIVFWNSFDETVRHFCWFSNFSWDKNLFQLDKVWLMFQKFQTLLSVPSEYANWIKKEGSDIPSKTKKRFIISSYFIHQYHTAATATWISIILFLFQRVYWKILDKRANQISCNLTRSFLLCR